MLAALVVAVALAVPVRSAPALDYLPAQDFELALQADLVVEGTIAAVGARPEGAPEETVPTFTLRVDEVVAGTCEARTLVVEQFEDWMCAQRWAPYRAGQRGVFHMRYRRDARGKVVDDAPLSVMGAGNEGECPILDGVAFREAFMSSETIAAKRKSVLIDGHDVHGVPVRCEELRAAVRGLRACYRWDTTPEEDRRHFAPAGLRQVCSGEELAAFEQSSPTARDLADTLRRWLEERRPR